MEENGFWNSEETERVNKYFGASAASLVKLAVMLGECESVEDVEALILKRSIVTFIALTESKFIRNRKKLEIIRMVNNLIIEFIEAKNERDLHKAKESLDRVMLGILVKITFKETRIQ